MLQGLSIAPSSRRQHARLESAMTIARESRVRGSQDAARAGRARRVDGCVYEQPTVFSRKILDFLGLVSLLRAISVPTSPVPASREARHLPHARAVASALEALSWATFTRLARRTHSGSTCGRGHRSSTREQLTESSPAHFRPSPT